MITYSDPGTASPTRDPEDTAEGTRGRVRTFLTFLHRYLWNLFHNLLVHPLLGIFDFHVPAWLNTLHDWSARRAWPTVELEPGNPESGDAPVPVLQYFLHGEYDAQLKVYSVGNTYRLTFRGVPLNPGPGSLRPLLLTAECSSLKAEDL